MAAVVVNSKVWVTAYCWDPDTTQASLNIWDGVCSALVGGGMTDADLADAIDQQINVFYKNALCTTDEWVGTGVRVINPPVINPTFFFTGNRGFGAEASVTLPNQLSAIASFRTAVGGRSGRGRKYYGLIPRTFSTANNELTAGGRTVYDAITGQFVAPGVYTKLGVTATIVWGVTNQAFDHHYPYTSATTQFSIATQRRRSAFGRTNTPPP